MVIRKGEPWGVAATTPAHLVAVGTDAALARALEHGDDPAAGLTVTGGDLHRTLGRPTVTSGRPSRRVPLDVLRCRLDGVERVAVAHVVARRGSWRGWWRGPIVAVLNVEHLGRWDVAPSGHPNDGRAEVVEVDPAMSLRQRHQAWRRLPSGTHVPHPHVRTTHRTHVEWAFDPPLDVYLDGVRHRRVRELTVTVAPDAYTLYV